MTLDSLEVSTAWAPPPRLFETERRRGAGGTGSKRKPEVAANTAEQIGHSKHRELSPPSSIANVVIYWTVSQPSPIYNQIESRLKVLTELGHQDGISPSTESLRAMQVFLASKRLKSRPLMYLQDNGNYRIIWRNVENEQVAIEFMDGNWAQFVIFKKASDGRMARVAGNVRLERLHSQITANAAESLLV